MLELFRRNLDFIAWENFADPRVYGLWLAALIAVGVCAYFAWLAGQLTYGERRYGSASEEFVLKTTVGLAVLVPLLFLLALVGAYRSVAMLLLAAALIAASAWRGGMRELIAPFHGWLRAVRDRRWLWALFLLTSLPALRPATRVDETGYHLAQVQQWVQHGALTVDPYMVYPLYTNNWHLLMGVEMLLGGVSAVHMLTWLGGVLTALFVLVLLEQAAVPDPLRSIATVALFVTPLFQRYLTVGLVDVPLMLYLTASVALVRGIGPSASPVTVRSLLPPALCVGMFMGMKISNFAFAPLFFGLAVARLRPRDAGRLVLLSLAFSSGWYARNLLIGGDPTPPMLHHALGMPDPFWSIEDVQRLTGDLKRGLSWAPLALLALPVRLVTSTEAGVLRDWPALGYVLLVPFTLLLVPQLRRRGALGLVASTWYAVALWIATTYLIRYAYFLPLAAVSGALVLHVAMQRFGAEAHRGIAALLAAVLMIGPTISALRYIKTPFAARVPVSGAERWKFEEAWAPSAALLDLASSVVPVGDTVYSLGVTQLKYYFERRGYPQIGYEFHRGRYPDLGRAIAAGRTSGFFQSLPARYVVVDTAAAARSLSMSGADVSRELDAAPALERVAGNALGAIYRVRASTTAGTP